MSTPDEPRDAPIQEPTLFAKEPGQLPPAPPGMTADEWARTFYGAGPKRVGGLSLGRGWLLAVVLLVVVAVFVVLAIITY